MHDLGYSGVAIAVALPVVCDPANPPALAYPDFAATMEALSDTIWDVVIAGTGIRQSLLALALSRSHKRVLHIDQNRYYGGTEAAFSLEEASKWSDESQHISREAYHLSAILAALVSSRLHTQIEFQAVGTWWIDRDRLVEVSESNKQNNGATDSHGGKGHPVVQPSGMLQKIPSTREDVFADDTLAPRDKRALMKFLRTLIMDPILDAESNQDHPIPSALTTLSAMPPLLAQPLLALSMSYDSPSAVRTKSVVSRIRRHIQSIGMFGPGFGAVMPKYGGGAEIAQVACRASAVGGAVYVLGRGLAKVDEPRVQSAEAEALAAASAEEVVRLELSDGEEIKARFVVGGAEDIPTGDIEGGARQLNIDLVKMVHSISIVSSPLEHLFPPTAESGPMPAGAVVVYDGHDHKTTSGYDSVSRAGPVYMVIHSSESGECPRGQCVIYSSTVSSSEGSEDANVQRLDDAIANLLAASPLSDSKSEVLWSLKYRLQGRPIDSDAGPVVSSQSGRVMLFPVASVDPVFDDSVLDGVKDIWKRILGNEVEVSEFLKFEERTEDDEEGL
ncbi:hypothetical protein EPUS_05544 [Endocarpon pusillum Z07020]|uniref:Rab proteins geranylgeranyltransferase n=1 Tax=Endocarpon pusillum (strain Z07020 / HMAS-L-300199) TaxID=1263415 RepID=U1HWQ0_ENDPU|nr:uncharacterized protein EPUS_05544 [Endocarpon pusillum Z07020]ERF73839.1 hypothetical protein EPUS_05544 [Endocarpon pusillum Z07020]